MALPLAPPAAAMAAARLASPRNPPTPPPPSKTLAANIAFLRGVRTKEQFRASWSTAALILASSGSGDIYDHESLLKAIKQVDVVISTVGVWHDQLADQTKIIAAIKEAGNIKRFFPSEFGHDVDRVHAVEPAKSVLEIKANIRRVVESEGIPYTIVASSFFAGYFLLTIAHVGATGPPTDKVVILGDGNTKAIFVSEEDIAIYTIKAADDPRTLNKILYLRPPANIVSHNELVSLWEKKTGKTLERVYLPEEQVLKQIQEATFPWSLALSIYHSVYIKGDHTNFEIDPSFGVEASQLYPVVKYTTIKELLNKYF